jgi:hypothetical protein
LISIPTGISTIFGFFHAMALILPAIPLLMMSADRVQFKSERNGPVGVGDRVFHDYGRPSVRAGLEKRWTTD